MRIPAWALLAFTAASVIFPSCREEHKIDIASRLNPKKMATMTTVNVATLISDSGVIQYKIVAPLWTVYDQVDTPYWNFPKGLYLQKYDPYFHVIATVAADSAKYFKNLKLWRLVCFCRSSCSGTKAGTRYTATRSCTSRPRRTCWRG